MMLKIEKDRADGGFAPDWSQLHLKEIIRI